MSGATAAKKSDGGGNFFSGSDSMEIVCEQLFNKRALGYLWSRRAELDAQQEKYITSLYNNRTKRKVEGSRSVTYKLSNTSAGLLGYGRLYGSIGSFETLEKEVRGTLCDEYYWDIDVVNCHPILLAQLASRRGQTLKEVEAFINDRDSFMKLVADNRDDAKAALFKIFYGGKCDFPLLKPLQAEVRRFTQSLMADDEFKPLLAAVKKADNLHGTFLSMILQTEERKVMLEMKDCLEALDYSVDVLAYDGVMVRKEGKTMAQLTEDMTITEQFIKDQTGYVVKLVNKPFQKFDIPNNDDEVAPKVLRSAYLEKKAEFEQRHAYNLHGDTIIEVLADGTLQQYSRLHAATALNSWDWIHSNKLCDRTAFVALWLNDPQRRQIRSITMKPSDDREKLVVPLRMAHEKVAPSDAAAKHLELWNTLLDLVSGRDAEKRSYFVKWLAHCLQKPFELPKTCIIITGQKGIGKDTLCDFFMEHVLGKHLTTNYNNTSQFFEKHDTGRVNKLMAKLEEANPHECNKNETSLNAIITASSVTVNPKLEKAYAYENFIRLIATLNAGMLCDDINRRGLYLTASPEKMGCHEFWTELRATLFTPEGGAAVAQELLRIDLTGFNPLVLPKDDYKDSVYNSVQTSEELFLEAWNGEECSAAALYRQLRDYCMDNELPYPDSAKGMGRKLMPFIRDKALVKRLSNSTTLYSKPSA
jgi:hypothetical protein